MALPDRLFDRVVVPLLRGREFDSVYLRDAFRSRYGIEIGLYSYGCFDRWRIPPGTRIGRYCSFAKSVRILNANHPIDALSTHPFLYDPAFGVVPESRVSATRVEIEDDVWFGHNATVAPGVARIGRGAIIGTGAVVTRDVPPYAIVAGVPGRVIRSRFPPATIARIEASRWWTLDRTALRDLVAREPDLLQLAATPEPAALA
ncbi:CatB-related O-acetyltransferase [Methylobacterium isbiliense]|jgi:acetyltransferase-like isoleucine patch superfamily enzyme|uniref:2,3,4,5-tetrahydropyridine-2,6-dicarboxylate N-acetyltransferase n=1 Tax=Methylobacterium isbiliense TaxID=315478 RepID=A0ABQ4SLI1_9HYPH|nr:CatB-related O-acetyltransferase [Methylobacterium isbiliense]MDN3626810.1 CatB-related O-acetyltransferase [Methylobacterium isbiliense]GJE04082.1 2,3,4,5-tetrahydropyridine-2,6-dicarboxylate N-acetyltransferase [Methylobacterium isbiliense]